jgi:SAM-dependent methyltransferase
MRQELDLLRNYPRAQRDPAARALAKTPEDQEIARQFGREFFDGERRHGYGGYSHDRARWRGVVADLVEQYREPLSVLDVGCAKGNLLAAFYDWYGGDVALAGIDVSRYAINDAIHLVKPHVIVGDARSLPWPTRAFELVVSINTLHNLEREGVIQALQEIERVGKDAYITVDAYRNEEERQRVFDWNLTALTILHVDEWRDLFKEAGYTGDYGFWVP